MDAGDDWRAQLSPMARSRVVNKILQTLRRHLPVSVPEDNVSVELQKIAVRFEDKVYAAATSQNEYLRKIALKLILMESWENTQQNPCPGAYKEEEKAMLTEGVNQMMEIALKLLNKKPRKEGILKIEDKAGDP